MAEPDEKHEMVGLVKRKLARFVPRIRRMVQLAKRSMVFSADVPLNAQNFSFGLLNVPVVVEFVATQYTIHEGEVVVHETVDLEQATLYFFEKDQHAIQDQAEWLHDGLYDTKHLVLEVLSDESNSRIRHYGGRKERTQGHLHKKGVDKQTYLF